MPYARHVPAAERTLRLLEALVAAPNGLTAGQLSEQLDISRSSLFALLNTLKARSYIEQNAGRQYQAGPALYKLIPGRQRARQALIEAFQSDVEIAALDETVALTRLDGLETVVIAQQESHRPVRSVLTIGQRRPASTSADGLVLLAGQFQAGLEPRPDQPADLHNQLQQVRQTRLAQTRSDELVELACPICTGSAQPDAALLLSVPAFRWQADPTRADRLRRSAARLSLRAGAAVYQPYSHNTAQAVEPTTALTEAEIGQFLRGARGARLACIRSDGTPHVVPLWYEWDEKFFWVMATPDASWAAYVMQNGWVALTIDESWPPLRRANISGEADAVPNSAIPGGANRLRQRLVNRYLGRSSAAPATDYSSWTTFRITPQKIVGRRGLVR